eukprot:scaffold2210_cov316-Pinguiococcus_pyrenoidosus.AAC.6
MRGRLARRGKPSSATFRTRKLPSASSSKLRRGMAPSRPTEYSLRRLMGPAELRLRRDGGKRQKRSDGCSFQGWFSLFRSLNSAECRTVARRSEQCCCYRMPEIRTLLANC